MIKLKTLAFVSIAGLTLAVAGCKKDKPADGGGAGSAGSAVAGSDTAGSAGSAAAPGSDTAGSAGSAAAPGSDTAGSAGSAAAAEDPNADKLEVFAKHNDPSKPDVTVKFTGITVVKATFDPAKLEGGSAELEVDLTNLASGIDKRDGHLKTADYLDTDKFPKASIKIDNVKGADKDYTADATVKVHDVEKKLPVKFTVVEAKDDWIRIQGEATFTRADFKVGKPGKEDGAADELTAKLQVTLKKS
jgi:polyisoprenoid-binding protein YceI